MENFEESLQKAEYTLRRIDHLTYITYPLIKDNRLLKKILEEIYDCAMNLVNATLYYDQLYKRLQMLNDFKTNMQLFSRTSARFLDPEEIRLMKEVIEMREAHRQSQFEYMRKDRFVVISENLRTNAIGIAQLKEYVNAMKGISRKIKETIEQKK